MELKNPIAFPLFSVIVPVYKVEQYLHQCVDSVLDQDFKDFEIILVDDGSPDNCPHICDEYAAKDKRVKVIHKENGGLSDARNFGIKASTSSYLMFLDSDDYWNDENLLSGLSEIISSQPDVEIVNFGWQKYFQNENRFIDDKRNFSILKEKQTGFSDFISRLLENDLFVASACNKCVSRQFILANNLYFKKGIRSEDMDWCGRILYLMPSMTCYNKKPYIYRQQVSGSITASVDTIHICDILQMIRSALTISDKLNLKEKKIFLSFFAVQYLTLLFNINSDKFHNFPDLHIEVKDLRSILKNDLNYKVKVANKFMKLFGFNLTSKLLHQYVSIKRG